MKVEMTDKDIKRILEEYKTIAVVGLSPKEDRPSYNVAKYLKSKGYRIIPVNPNAKEVLEEVSYPDLKSIPEKVDIVDIFRRSEDVPPVIDEAITIGAMVIWMQEGIINESAGEKARKAGIEVVMDRCMLKEHKRLTPL